MRSLVKKLEKILREKKIRVVTAESCTGGLLASLITAIPGASDIFERGFITYSNESKHELLGVPSETLKRHGAVSSQTAEAMAAGALKHSHADIAVAVTGIAGPGGGSKLKPVGTVFIAYAAKNHKPFSSRLTFSGSRSEIQKQTAETALRTLLGALEDKT